ncbi:MAG: ApaG domain [Opitutales bacterium]|nr:ApaG domain [Opitutales bacterium]NRA25674.1 ApaG domain [Opitutales bacterium]
MNALSERPIELEGLKVSVDSVVYHYDPDISPEPERPHAFIYFISIKNLSNQTVTLDRRRWILGYHDGTREILDCPTIMGENPTIPQGGTYSYNSYHFAERSTYVSGSYLGLSIELQPIFARIPPFWMEVPEPDRQMELGI